MVVGGLALAVDVVSMSHGSQICVPFRPGAPGSPGSPRLPLSPVGPANGSAELVGREICEATIVTTGSLRFADTDKIITNT